MFDFIRLSLPKDRLLNIRKLIKLIAYCTFRLQILLCGKNKSPQLLIFTFVYHENNYPSPHNYYLDTLVMVFKVFLERKRRKSDKKVKTHSFEEKLLEKAHLTPLKKSQNTGIFREEGPVLSKFDHYRDLILTSSFNTFNFLIL